MKKVIEYFKNDFKNVESAIDILSNGKTPKWAVVVWYMVLAPIGLVLLPIVKFLAPIVMNIYINRLGKKYGA